MILDMKPKKNTNFNNYKVAIEEMSKFRYDLN